MNEKSNRNSTIRNRKTGKTGVVKTARRILAGYMALLLVFTSYVVLDTFVITRVYGSEVSGADNSGSAGSGSDSGSNSEDQDGTDLSGNGLNDNDPDSGSSPGSGNQSGDSKSGTGGDGSGHRGQGSNGRGGHGPGKHRSESSGSSGGSSSSSGSSGSSSTAGGSGNSSELSGGSSQSSGSKSAAASAVTADSYSDDNIKITLTEYRENDTTIYVADVQVSDPSYLKTALAQGAYGKNVTARTSEIAEGVKAILAINGDYYGAQENGYVIRNGTLYRSTAVSGSEDLVIYKDGSWKIINESDVTAQQLISDGAVQTLSFGPALVENSKVAVTEGEEVGKAMASNPRTAIGLIDDCHYVLVVSDGRTSESSGLSLYQLAEFMQSLGVRTAYNLDGGGSSTMYFNGQVVNNPTTGGSNIRERSVSDIVYIG